MPRASSDLRLERLVKAYGSVPAVKGIDVTVPAGAMVSLIGPSGCGKTTTLRMVAGLEMPTAGRILRGDAVLSDGAAAVPPEKRDMGMVFQTYALWPHMTVEGNVAYGLRRRGMARADVAARVKRTLELVAMAPYATRYPGQLSGGQQQRVALARAVASEPSILLFDEPLSNLDAQLREEMRFEIRALQQRLGTTSLYVTHSQEEALALSDTVVVMRAGEIAQIGTPQGLYDQPRTAFVAGFIGLANLLALTDADGTLRGRLGDAVVAAGAGATHRRGAVTVSIRPADIRVLPDVAAVPPGWNTLHGTVTASVLTGSVVDTFVALATDAGTVVRVQSLPPAVGAPGQPVVLAFDPARTVALED